MVEYKVEASLVEGNGVGGGQNADVLDTRCGRMSVAVAVHRHIVHHIDINNVLAFLLEVVVHSLCRSSHRLKETILISDCPVLLALARRVDVEFPGGRGHANRLVLQHTAEAAHGMSLEVGQVDHEIVVLKVRAYDVVLNMLRVFDRQLHFAFLVHDVNGGDVVVAAFGDGLTVLLGVATVAAVSRVAFH